MVFAATPPASS